MPDSLNDLQVIFAFLQVAEQKPGYQQTQAFKDWYATYSQAAAAFSILAPRTKSFVVKERLRTRPKEFGTVLKNYRDEGRTGADFERTLIGEARDRSDDVDLKSFQDSFKKLISVSSYLLDLENRRATGESKSATAQAKSQSVVSTDIKRQASPVQSSAGGLQTTAQAATSQASIPQAAASPLSTTGELRVVGAGGHDADLEKASSALTDLTTALMTARQELGSVRRQLETTRDVLSMTRDRLAAAQSELDGAHRQMDATQRQLEVNAASAQELAYSVRTLSTERVPRAVHEKMTLRAKTAEEKAKNAEDKEVLQRQKAQKEFDDYTSNVTLQVLGILNQLSGLSSNPTAHSGHEGGNQRDRENFEFLASQHTTTVSLLLKLLEEVGGLTRYNVRAGDTFDPKFMEQRITVPGERGNSGKVAQVHEWGFVQQDGAVFQRAVVSVYG